MKKLSINQNEYIIPKQLKLKPEIVKYITWIKQKSTYDIKDL